MISHEDTVRLGDYLVAGRQVRDGAADIMWAALRWGARGQGINVTAFAHHLHTTPMILRKRLVRSGLPPTKRIIRLAAACSVVDDLVSGKGSIETVARRYGWSGHPAFWYWCRQECGVPPTVLVDTAHRYGEAIRAVIKYIT